LIIKGKQYKIEDGQLDKGRLFLHRPIVCPPPPPIYSLFCNQVKAAMTM
jgi:hypothetical protein